VGAWLNAILGAGQPPKLRAYRTDKERGAPYDGTDASEIVGTVYTSGSREHHVVVVGGGFGGLQAVSKLRHAPVEVTLVDRRNFHLFQPLTYQVATGGLSPGEIAYPLRAIFKRDRNVGVLLAEVADFDLDARELHLRSVCGVPVPERLGYDTLIVAGGSHYSYFGHEEWRMHAAEVKSLESALAVRSRLLAAFEAAEALSTRLNEPPGFDPTASIAATVASGVLPFRPELRPDSSTRFVISLVCNGSPAARSTSIATCFADSPRIRLPCIGAPFRCRGQGVPAPLAHLREWRRP
jgi:hypothetical protein